MFSGFFSAGVWIVCNRKKQSCTLGSFFIGTLFLRCAEDWGFEISCVIPWMVKYSIDSQQQQKTENCMQLLWFEKFVLRFGLLHERETYQRNPSSRDKSLLGCTLFSRAKLRLSVSAASIRTSIYPSVDREYASAKNLRFPSGVWENSVSRLSWAQSILWKSIFEHIFLLYVNPHTHVLTRTAHTCFLRTCRYYEYRTQHKPYRECWIFTKPFSCSSPGCLVYGMLEK